MVTFGEMIYIFTHEERILSCIENIHNFVKVKRAFECMSPLYTIKENLPYLQIIKDLVDLEAIDDNLYEDAT
jgi:hypothetical protein